MTAASLRATLRPRRTRGWVLLLAAVFAVLQLANVGGRDTPDTKNYLSYTMSLLGQDKREAAGVTIEYVCTSQASVARRDQKVDVRRFHRASPARKVAADCRSGHWRTVDERLKAGQTGGHTTPFMSERFQRIFEVRPGYPAFLVPFVATFGVKWGLWTAGVTVASSCGVLVFLVLRSLRARRTLALTGQALFYALPCGATAMRPMTEGLLLLFTLSALWGCALVLRGRDGTGAMLVSLSLAALFTVKHSQALFLGLCLAAAGTAVALRRLRHARPMGRGVVAVAAASAYGALATVVAAWALDHPSLTDSVQDLLTDHFQRPDRAAPWREFAHLEFNFWVEWTRRQLWEPLFAVALAAGAWGALRRRPAFGVFLIGAAGTGVLTQAAHPDLGIWGGRLIVLAWVLPVVGLPLLLESLTTRQGPFSPTSVPLRLPHPTPGAGPWPPRSAPTAPAPDATPAPLTAATPRNSDTAGTSPASPSPAGTSPASSSSAGASPGSSSSAGSFPAGASPAGSSSAGASPAGASPASSSSTGASPAGGWAAQRAARAGAGGKDARDGSLHRASALQPAPPAPRAAEAPTAPEPAHSRPRPRPRPLTVTTAAHHPPTALAHLASRSGPGPDKAPGKSPGKGPGKDVAPGTGKLSRRDRGKRRAKADDQGKGRGKGRGDSPSPGGPKT